MRYLIDYRCAFQFNEAISEQQTELRLIPRDNEYQKTLSSNLQLIPHAETHEHRDAFGNRVQSFSMVRNHEAWELHFKAEVENTLGNPFDHSPLTPEEERAGVKRLVAEQPRNWDFLLPHGTTVPALAKLTRQEKWPSYDSEKNVIYSIQSAMDWMMSEFSYEPGATDVHAPLEEVLEKRSGVCQDFSHLLVTLVRHWGFPARYVMGYQYLKPSEEKPLNPATHAWTEVFLPGVGWRGFDATHSLLANDTYIPVAVGRDSQDAAPERGSFKGPSEGSKPVIQLVLSQQ